MGRPLAWVSFLSLILQLQPDLPRSLPWPQLLSGLPLHGGTVLPPLWRLPAV